MSDSQLLFKYLDAGAKSSVVVLDTKLSTCNDQTVYLYHQKRDQIIEYRRDIVETKLRELTDNEEKQTTGLQNAYQQSRAAFTPRGAAILDIPEHAPPPKPVAASVGSDDDIVDDDIGLIDDSELLDEDEDDVEDEED